MRDLLQAGDRYACPRCHQVHVLEQPFADHTTAARVHLYVTCQGQRYFVGQLPTTPIPRENT